MEQLPIFLNLSGKNVVLVGEGDAADAKRRLIERAGGICVSDCPNLVCRCARVAFVAIDDDDAAAKADAARLRAKGMLVNVVDRPEYCDFTTPAIVERTPILIAVGTGGASAGMAKAIRQRIEGLLPQNVGALAAAVSAAREAIRSVWPDASARRRALDAAFRPGGALDPFTDKSGVAVDDWLRWSGGGGKTAAQNGLVQIALSSNDPDDLTLRAARLLGEADHVFHDTLVAPTILARARADAVRHAGPPPADIPGGLCLHLTIATDDAK
jgi:uroporphyrin-III C-methyltransferase/precorrin-2 dehydrogenase/sirohydrochlorin ferrochelatase